MVFYAVRIGGRAGVFASWIECQKYYANQSGAQVRMFRSAGAAHHWADASRTSASPPTVAIGTTQSGPRPRPTPLANKPRAHKRSAVRTQPHATIVPYVAPQPRVPIASPAPTLLADSPLVPTRRTVRKRIGFKSAAPSPKPAVSIPPAWQPWCLAHNHCISQCSAQLVHVYTDGACKNNQRASHARAGYGIWFGEQDSRNVSKRLPGVRQTNQRAELMALVELLETYPTLGMTVHSDSTYINGLASKCTRAYPKSYEATVNQDLVGRLGTCISTRLEVGACTQCLQFIHVRGHSGNRGNDGADACAVAGALRD